MFRLRSAFAAAKQRFQQQIPSMLRFKTTKAAASGFGIVAIAQQYPFAFQVAFSTLKTSAADLIAQCGVEGKKPSEGQIDWKRNGVFIVFGAVYLGGFQWFILVTQYRKWFPGMDKFANATMAEKMKDIPGMITTVKQIAFDICILFPCIYFPVFYSVKELVQGKSSNPVDWVTDGVAKYYKNCRTDILAMATFWGPSDVLVCTVPMWLRMPCRHVLSLGWTAYLSYLRGATIPSGPAPPK